MTHSSLRNFINVLAIAAVVLTTSSCAATVPEPQAVGEDAALNGVQLAAQPVIAAHRGGLDEGPEGSTAALKAAGEDGFAVEFDLQALADGQWAVAHDDDVERILEDRSGPVSEMTTEDWRNSCILPPDGATDTGGCGHPAVWTDLAELLPTSAILMPELKGKSIPVDDFIRSVKEQGMERRVIAQSFSGRETTRMATGGLHTMRLSMSCPKLDLSAIAGNGIEYLGISRKCGTDFVAKAQRHGLKVWVWGIDGADETRKWVKAGIDGIFADYPKRMRSELQTKS